MYTFYPLNSIVKFLLQFTHILLTDDVIDDVSSNTEGSSMSRRVSQDAEIGNGYLVPDFRGLVFLELKPVFSSRAKSSLYNSKLNSKSIFADVVWKKETNKFRTFVFEF